MLTTPPMIPTAVPPEKGIDESCFGASDRVRFWREARRDLEFLTATFRRHRYRPHTHDTYVIGVVEAGCLSFVLGRTRYYLPAGSLCFVNPGEVHDGEPANGGFSYRMSYPSLGLIQRLAEGMPGARAGAIPNFPRPVVSDPEGYRRFHRAHEALEREPDPLAVDEEMTAAFGFLVRRHSTWRGGEEAAGRAPRTVAMMRDFLEAHYAESIDLERLAGVAGVTPYQAIRLFRRTLGLTPHAYLSDVRVRRAETMLRSDLPPSDVALACGFCDQSHLTRAFKARRGVTPASFARPGPRTERVSRDRR